MHNVMVCGILSLVGPSPATSEPEFELIRAFVAHEALFDGIQMMHIINKELLVHIIDKDKEPSVHIKLYELM